MFQIDLPIDVMGTGEAVVVAEVTHKGKKKDAIAHCALVIISKLRRIFSPTVVQILVGDKKYPLFF